MEDMAIVTVPFVNNEVLYNLSVETYKEFPKQVHKIAVVNNMEYDKAEEMINKYNDKIIMNDVNCLSKAWNIGIKDGINSGFNYLFVPNLDVNFKIGSIRNLYLFHKSVCNKAGITSMKVVARKRFFDRMSIDKPKNSHTEYMRRFNIFSAFMIGKDVYEKVGEFDENFVPAYCEDFDYIIRLWKSGYRPIKTSSGLYLHRPGSTANKGKVRIYLNKNRKYLLKKWDVESIDELFKRYMPQEVKKK